MRAPLAFLLEGARALSEERTTCTAITLQRRLRVSPRMARYLEEELRDQLFL